MSRKKVDVVSCDVAGCTNMWPVEDENQGDRCYICRSDYCMEHGPVVAVTVNIPAREPVTSIDKKTRNMVVKVPSLCPKCEDKLKNILDAEEENYELTRGIKEAVYGVLEK